MDKYSRIRKRGESKKKENGVWKQKGTNKYGFRR